MLKRVNHNEMLQQQPETIGHEREVENPPSDRALYDPRRVIGRRTNLQAEWNAIKAVIVT